MPSESVTFALAIIGAATGTTSAVAQVYTTVRDRPRVSVSFGYTERANGRPTVYIDVTNLGHRPTTVREVGFYAHPREFQIIRQGETQPWATAKGEITFATGPFFLEAGQSERVELVPNIDAWGIHADLPLRVFAVDIRHRRIWGDAAPIIRMLVGENPPLRGSDPEELRRLFIPPRPELRPSQVEPRWKVWKRRELRQPQTWRPD